MSKANHWTYAAANNLPLHKKLAERGGVGFRLGRRRSDYRDRVDLWVFAAGILDATRYLNLSVMHIETDLHDEFDGNRRERNIYFELRGFLEENYADLFKWFRRTYSEATGNFADVDNIKTVLHGIVFDRADYANVTDPFALLFAAVE